MTHKNPLFCACAYAVRDLGKEPVYIIIRFGGGGGELTRVVFIYVEVRGA